MIQINAGRRLMAARVTAAVKDTIKDLLAAGANPRAEGHEDTWHIEGVRMKHAAANKIIKALIQMGYKAELEKTTSGGKAGALTKGSSEIHVIDSDAQGFTNMIVRD